MRKAILAAVVLAVVAATIAYAQVINSPFQTTVGGCVYNSSAPTGTNANAIYLQCDVNGNLKTSSSGTPTGTQNVSGPISLAYTGTGYAPTKTSTISQGLVAKSSAGQLWSIYATNTTGVAGYFMVFDSATLPADGTVTPSECVQLPANSATSLSFNSGPPATYSSGIIGFMSTTGCYTKTTSGTLSGFIRAAVN